MFAVTGWNVPTSSLATQTLSPTVLAKKAKKAEQAKAHKEKLKQKKNASEGNQIPLGKKRAGFGDDSDGEEKLKMQGKKEKKVEKKNNLKEEDISTKSNGAGVGVDKGPKITEDNLQKLYEQVIEGKSASASAGKKKRKRGKKAGNAHPAAEGPGEKAISAREQNGQSTSTSTSTFQDGLSEPARKKHKKDKNPKLKDTTIDDLVASVQPPPAETALPTLASIPALTPLQQKMRAKLTSARFRHLNESLYTAPSSESFSLFRTQPSMFHDYHAGFRQQVQAWPENPVDIFIKQLLSRASAKAAPKDNNKNKPTNPHGGREQIKPLPRPPPTYTCTIADLGCGDAKLAATLTPISEKKNLNLKIHSFDLTSSGNSLVTEADIANLPLEKETVDIAIFCLALMGTNYLDFIEEAFRILRFGGELWIAEIKSRFTSTGEILGSNNGTAPPPPPPQTASGEMGNKGKIGVLKTSHSDGDDGDDFDLSGAEDNETHSKPSPTTINQTYTPFITALSRRGFILKTDTQNNPIVDDRNKMFVRMEFFKPRPKIERAKPGEGNPDYDLSKEGRGGRGGGGGGGKGRGMGMIKGKKGKWMEETEVDIRKREEKLLKPCVYKLR